MNHRNYIIATLLFLAGMLKGYELYVLNNVGELGVQLEYMRQDLASLEHEKKLLQEEIIRCESLQEIETRATELGFGEPRYLILK